MTLDEVRSYFGSDNKTCQALDIYRQNFTNWRKAGYIPLIQQYKIEALTKGALLASEKDIILNRYSKTRRDSTYEQTNNINNNKRNQASLKKACNEKLK